MTIKDLIKRIERKEHVYLDEIRAAIPEAGLRDFDVIAERMSGVNPSEVAYFVGAIEFSDDPVEALEVLRKQTPVSGVEWKQKFDFRSFFAEEGLAHQGREQNGISHDADRIGLTLDFDSTGKYGSTATCPRYDTSFSGGSFENVVKEYEGGK